METKSLALAELKILGADGEAGTLEGYASKFGGVDSYGDTIEPGAYSDLLPEFIRDGFLAVDHSWSDRIGTIREAKEDANGLYFVAEYHSDQRSQGARQRAVERLARGKSVQLSIGYETLGYEMRRLDAPILGPYGKVEEVRVLTKIRLYEISDVAVAADSAALATGAKTNHTYADHGSRVLADVEAFLARSRSLTDLRAKEGRVLSAANRSKLEALLETLAGLDPVKAIIEELLAASDPAPKGKAAPNDVLTEYLRFQHLTTQLEHAL